jgi:hypothetical protein
VKPCPECGHAPWDWWTRGCPTCTAFICRRLAIPPELAHLAVDIGRKVQEHGWSAIGVAPSVDDPDPQLPFTYTLGLWPVRAMPDMIVFTLPFERAHGVIQGAIEAIEETPALAQGGFTEKVLVGYPVEIVRLQPQAAAEYLRWTRLFNQPDNDLPACQVVWPDPQGRFDMSDEVQPRIARDTTAT